MAGIIEMILTIALDGAIDAAGSTRVSLPVRIAVILILIAFVSVTSLPLLLVGLETGKTGLVVLAAALLTAYSLIIISAIRKRSR